MRRSHGDGTLLPPPYHQAAGDQLPPITVASSTARNAGLSAVSQVLDTTGDGTADAILIDTDGDGVPDQLVNSVSFPGSRPTPVKAHVIDTQGDGIADSVVVDTTGDGIPNSLVKIGAKPASTF